MCRSIGPLGLPLALALVPLVLASSAADAQRPDFMFYEPRGSFSLYGGWSMPREGSDIFEELRRDLTIERGDFNGPLLGGEVAFQLMDRLDLALGVEHARAERHSELRHFIEPTPQGPLPIEQTTDFTWTRATAGARVYLLNRGLAIGQHAWIPTRWSPFVGGGGGVVWYALDQFGDFIDFQTIDDPEGPLILPDRRARSTGNGATAHLLAGLDVTVTRNLVLRGEYRYHWGSAALDARAFRDFDPIDLAGHRATIGIATRF